MNELTVVTGDGTMTRSQMYQSFMANPKPFEQEAADRRMSLPVLLNEKSPVPEKSKDHPVALSSMLGRADLYISSNSNSATSTAADFMKTSATRALFWSVLDRDFDEHLGLYEIENNRENYASATNTEQDLTPGGAFNPRTTLPLVDRRKFRPRISISDIAGSVQTIPGNSYQTPEYNTPDTDHRMRPVPPTTPIPTTTLTVSERVGSLKKIGEGLRVDANMEFSNLFMESIRMWVAKLALHTETSIVNAGIRILYESVDNVAARTFEAIGATPNLKSIIKVNLHTGPGNSYMYNLLIMREAEIETWIEANTLALGATSSGQTTTQAMIPQAGRFVSVFPGVTLLNSVSGPTVTAFVGNSEIPGWSTDNFIGVDQRFALSLMRRARGTRDEGDYDPETQVRRRFLSQHFDWYLEDINAVKGWAFN